MCEWCTLHFRYDPHPTGTLTYWTWEGASPNACRARNENDEIHRQNAMMAWYLHPEDCYVNPPKG